MPLNCWVGNAIESIDSHGTCGKAAQTNSCTTWRYLYTKNISDTHNTLVYTGILGLTRKVNVIKDNCGGCFFYTKYTRLWGTLDLRWMIVISAHNMFRLNATVPNMLRWVDEHGCSPCSVQIKRGPCTDCLVKPPPLVQRTWQSCACRSLNCATDEFRCLWTKCTTNKTRSTVSTYNLLK
jgi:hypothetical protein